MDLCVWRSTTCVTEGQAAAIIDLYECPTVCIPTRTFFPWEVTESVHSWKFILYKRATKTMH
jgi:hypothetical protein